MTSSAALERTRGAPGGETPGWDAGNPRSTTPLKRRHDPQQYSDNNIDNSSNNIGVDNTVTTLSPQQPEQQQQREHPDQPPAKRRQNQHQR